MKALPKLKITVFLCGFILMVFELVGLRVLSPFLGSSSIVWTSVIGVILIFMSFGYIMGGKLADKYHSQKPLELILLGASVAIIFMNVSKNILLLQINTFDFSLITKSLIACIILFSIPAFLLAMVGPFAIRLSFDTKENAGSMAGEIYALSTLGSIVGTFTGGFVLISYFGTNLIIYGLSILLFLLALLFKIKGVNKITWTVAFLMIVNGLLFAKSRDFIDVDTQYSRIFIQSSSYLNQDAKFLFLDGYINSGMFTQKPTELIFEYTQFFDVFTFFKSDCESVLLLGGGGFSYPKHFQEKFPNTRLDIVEIDGDLTQIAREHFAFTPQKNTHVIIEDARYYLQQTSSTYDVICYDVLKSPLSIPFHLTTQEAFKEAHAILNEDGVLILNLLGDLNAGSARFIESELRTLQSVFPQVQIYSAQEKNATGLQNFMFVALKTKIDLDRNQIPSSLKKLLANPISINPKSNSFILTDDYAPIESLVEG